MPATRASPTRLAALALVAVAATVHAVAAATDDDGCTPRQVWKDRKTHAA